MRKTLREAASDDYWLSRWAAAPVDDAAEGADQYPLLYANMVISDDEAGEVLELGCGPGRLLRRYHANGIRIIGVDNVSVAVEKLKACDPQLRVQCADARSLPFENERFSVVLCFGVFHSLEHGTPQALNEAFRVLRKNGVLCAEFRADSVHNLLIDVYKGLGKRADKFHKWNYRREEARELLRQAGFTIESEHPAINMPLLYHVPYFRHPSQRHKSQRELRASGYRLRPRIEQLLLALARIAPDSTSNEHIFICRKPAERGAG